jgi:acyl-CoA thioesterase
MSGMTDFSTAMQLTPVGDRRWAVDLPADWAQGRTTFGGLIGALAARVAGQVAGAERPLRTLDIAFVAPLPRGPAEVAAEVLSAGKAVTQLVVSFTSGGVLGARVHVVAGASRVSALRVETGPAEMIEGDPAGQGIELPYVPGVMPTFGQHIEYRWCSEAFPFTGGGPETARVNGWARHRTAAHGLEALLALLDAWPPVVLPMATGPIPASTVRWAIHLAATAEIVEPAPAAVAGLVSGPDGAGRVTGFETDRQWVWYEARTVQCADGYATAYASMYAGGRLLAWSEQLIVVYDKPVAAPDPAAAVAAVPSGVPAAGGPVAVVEPGAPA